MDFNIIEGLTEEELNELYDDNVIKDLYTSYSGTCFCYSTKLGTIHFGSLNWHVWRFSFGYCGLRLSDRKSCVDLCHNQEFSHQSFYEWCWCTVSGHASHSTWWECSR